MGRTSGRSSEPHLRPVEKVRLNEKYVRWRLAGVICLLFLAAGAIGYGVYQWLQVETGWREIEANASADTNCSEDFIFQYELGASGMNAGTEYRTICSLYTDGCVTAYRLFNNDSGFDGLVNVYEINQHPNEVLQVDEALYRALELAANQESRSLYLAPVYRVYDTIFYCSEDYQIYDFDPVQNPDAAREIEQTLSYAGDKSHVQLKLLGSGKVCLFVSEEYLAYAREELGEYNFIDFYWMKNAFIVDYLAGIMEENGFTCGSISSYDGFIRNLDRRAVSYSFNIYDREENVIYPAAVMNYSGSISLVYLRNYPMSKRDSVHYYELADGGQRYCYIDSADGLCKSSTDSLVAYSDGKGCSELLMDMIPVYIADEWDPVPLKEAGDEVIYCENRQIFYSEQTLQLTSVYQDETVRYQKKLLWEQAE